MEEARRSTERPSKADALLRYYMQQNRTNPLGLTRPLDFVAHELKPLNISDGLAWNCSFDPRTESIDLLLSLSGVPVLTEVKMAGDKFVSAAVVQVLYYASMMANENQMARLVREIGGHTTQEMRLCIIAQERDESKSKEKGFTNDLRSALSFLQHEATCQTMAPYFRGIAIIVIKELPEPFSRATNTPAYRVTDGGEHFIDWNLH